MAILKAKPIPPQAPVPLRKDGRDPEDRRKRVTTKLDEVIGRPAADESESNLREAAAAVLSGDMSEKQAKSAYEVTQYQLQKFIQRTFATEEDKYEFLEGCMISNAVLASSIFEKKHDDLSAIDAARAATMFAGKATDIRKARQADFKEPPLNVSVILSLEKTLKTIQIESEVTRLPAIPIPSDK